VRITSELYLKDVTHCVYVMTLSIVTKASREEAPYNRRVFCFRNFRR